MTIKQIIFFGIFFTFLSFSAFGQETVKPNGYNVFHYTNGTVSSEGHFKDGKPVGYWKSYYPDGVIRSEGNRTDNELDSLWKFYDRDGNLEKIIDYKKGKKSGYLLKYQLVEDSSSSDNVLISKELYIDDKLEGLSYYYADDGTLEHTTQYKAGEKHGLEKYYASDSRITAILRYAYGNMLSSESINQYDKNGNKTGVWKEFYPDGQLKRFETYEAGKLNGYYRDYSPIGLIEKQVLYTKGEIQTNSDKEFNTKTEIVVKTFEDGTPKSKGAFKSDKPVGIHREFAPDGTITAAYEYDENSILIGKGLVTPEGRRVGEWELFYPDGSVQAKGKYDAGKRNGEWTFFFENQIKQQVGDYKNGKPEGKWMWFYPDGSVRRTGFYVNGKEEGPFVELGVNQDTISTGKYVYGMRTGEWRIAVNDHVEIGTYAAGKKNGVWKNYFADNRLEFTGEFKSGFPDGEHLYYFPNETRKLKANYGMGIKDGTWIKYDGFGNPLTVFLYQSGELIKIDGKKVKDE